MNTFVGTFLDRDWALIARSKAQHWRRLFEEEGAGPALEASDALVLIVKNFHADWPTDEDRQLDLTAHIRLSELLARVGRLSH